jgi:predicted dehydrogenase
MNNRLPSPITRRNFFEKSALATAGAVLLGPRLVRAAATTQANSKLNLGVIGVAGRGGDNLNGVASQNIVALCDVDDRNLANAAKRFPGAKTYNDFRRLVDHKDLDAIVVSTPDHTHAVASVAVLKSGRHLYCEKPLTRTVSEARIVTDLARKQKRVTQIGTQIHAGNNYRRVVELVKTGAIGPIREVHVWVNAIYGGMDLPKETPPVPEYLHYDLWLGPVESRPYSPEWVPFKWRNWWAFGGGSLADFGCHYMDLPFWALDLKYPETVEAVDGPPVHPESTPPWLIVKYHYGSRGTQPALDLTWYHGGKQPARLTQEQAAQWKSGVLFVGAKGQLMSDYGRHVLLPEKDYTDFKRPDPFIPNSIGHHEEWIEACKTGGTTTCNFNYSGPLSEAALLGNVAYRAQKKLDWNPRSLRAENCPEADAFLQHRYRKGWKI